MLFSLKTFPKPRATSFIILLRAVLNHDQLHRSTTRAQSNANAAFVHYSFIIFTCKCNGSTLYAVLFNRTGKNNFGFFFIVLNFCREAIQNTCLKLYQFARNKKLY